MNALKRLVTRVGLPVLNKLDRVQPAQSAGLRYRFRRKLWMRQLRELDLARYRVEQARDLGVVVGNGCRFYSLNIYSEPYLVEFGDNVIVSGNVVFLTHDGAIYLLREEIPALRGSYGGIRIGSNCFIGMGAIILPNVSIGNDCIVGAGAVVTRSFGDGTILMGNPARPALTMQMYRNMKLGSPQVVTSTSYPFPGRIPEDEKRRLLMARRDELMPSVAESPGRAAAGEVAVEPRLAGDSSSHGSG